MVMKIARPIRTEFGGTCAVPMADLTMDSTTIILRNEVMEISRKGSSDINASAIIICTLLENPGEDIAAAISMPPLAGVAAKEGSNDKRI